MCAVGGSNGGYDTERTALFAAEMKAHYKNYYSDEEITKRIDEIINSSGLSKEDIDREFLFNATKAVGRAYEAELDDSIEQTVKLMSLYAAQNYCRSVAPDYDYRVGGNTGEDDFNKFNPNAIYDPNFQSFMDAKYPVNTYGKVFTGKSRYLNFRVSASDF